MQTFKIMLVIACLLYLVSANPMNCFNETHDISAYFTEQNCYEYPFPVLVDTYLLFRGIADINVAKN